MAKPKEVYRETYKPGAATVRRELLPGRLPYMSKDFVVDSMEVRAAGHMDDGREFQDIRVYTREVSGADKGEV